MARTRRFILLAVAALILAGIAVPFIMRSRVQADRVGCQNHLRELGLLGVRHAAVPGQGLPPGSRDELPPGTFENVTLPPEQRMSWYAYTLGILSGDRPSADAQTKQRKPSGLTEALVAFDGTAPWNGTPNAALSNYRLTTAICPAQVPVFASGSPVSTNYVAIGGIGTETPARSIDLAGKDAGAYRYERSTPDKAFIDGLRQTAQIIETNLDLGPWLQGGPGTLRGLDSAATPYLGIGRPYGGCHPGGVYASMADGSVRFINDTIDPAVFRALLTIAGGPGEQDFDAP